MNSPLRGRDVRHTTASVALMALALTACAQQDPPGVGIESLSANVIFGVAALTDVPAPVAPPVFQQLPLPLPQQVPTLAPIADIGPPPLPPLPPFQECPVAGLNAFPEEAAARNVAPDRRPAEGTYRWKRDGNQRRAELLNLPIPIGGFEARTIANLDAIDDTTFTYETTQPDLVGNTVTRTWQVRTDGTSAGPSDAPVAVPGVDIDGDGQNDVGADQIPTVGDVDRGLALVSVVYTDPEGTELGRFAPTSPLLVMPFPVRVSETFTSQATDPLTFQSWQFANAEVLPAERIDACGDVVEGFGVQGTLNFTDSEGATQTATYKIVVVPQMGGIVVAEESHTGTEGGSGTDVFQNIGQLAPDEAEAP